VSAEHVETIQLSFVHSQHKPVWHASKETFSPEGGVGLVLKRGCLLTLAYYAFPR
jgi:hypothetical protein